MMVEPILTARTRAEQEMAVRCSIIVPAGHDLLTLEAYVIHLSEQDLPREYELVIINNHGLVIDEGRFRQYVPGLKILNGNGISGEEQFFDMGAMATSGKFLLFVRRPVPFDKTILAQAIRDLENSVEKISVSSGKTFVLVERLHYASTRGSAEPLSSIDPPPGHHYEKESPGFQTPKGKVLLVVCLFENNFGDRIIYDTVNEKLKNAGFQTEIAEVSQSLSRSKLIEKANNSDFLYFVGGGIIERWSPEIIRRFDTFHELIRVPYGVVGLSTGEFSYAASSGSLKLFSEKASFFYTRDAESIETFRRAGACHLPVAGADVAFANGRLTQLKRTGANITANFRNVPYIDITGDLDWKMWSTALTKIGVKRLIPDCSDAQEQLGIPISKNGILGEICSSNIIVAMRFHVILAASMIGILTIPVIYCPKTKRLARQLGIEEYCLELTDHGKLESTFRRLEGNQQLVRERLKARVSQLRACAEKMIRDSILVVEQSVNERPHSRIR